MVERKRVVFHVGPHKTGTTAIQQALRDCRACAYPRTAVHGPGHAELAFKAFGLNRYPVDAETLVRTVAAAEGPTVVLSSEEFARAVQTNVDTSALQALTRDHDVELVFTLTPTRARMTAEVQELIKQGQAINLAGAPSLLPLFVQRPGLRPDFIARWLDLAPWQAVHVVRTDKSQHAVIYEAFEAILGCRLPRPSANAQRDNARWPYVQTQIMSMLNNTTADVPVERRRKAAQGAYAALQEVMAEVSATDYPNLPGPIAHIADMIWYAQDAHIRHMAASGQAKIYGETPREQG